MKCAAALFALTVLLALGASAQAQFAPTGTFYVRVDSLSPPVVDLNTKKPPFLPARQWHTLTTSDLGVPDDAAAVQIKIRGHTTKGQRDKGAATRIWFCTVQCPSNLSTRYPHLKARAADGATGEREDATVLVHIVDRKIAWRWENSGPPGTNSSIIFWVEGYWSQPNRDVSRLHQVLSTATK